MNANKILKALKGFEKRELRNMDDVLDKLKVEKVEDFNFNTMNEQELKEFWAFVKLVIKSGIKNDRDRAELERMRLANTEIVECTIKTIWNVSQRLFGSAIRGFESIIKINGNDIEIFGDRNEVHFRINGETEAYESRVYQGSETYAHKFLYKILKERGII